MIDFIIESGIFWGVLGIVGFFLIIFILKAFIKIALPNKMLVVTGEQTVKHGRKFGFTVARGRALVTPYLQEYNIMDLGVLPINVRVEGVNSANGITVGADATACVCIDDDNEPMLYSAVERLMGKSREEIQDQIQQTLIGNFRGALNKATPLQSIGMEEVADEHEDDAEDQDDSLTEDSADSTEKIVEGDRALFRNDLLQDINGDLSNFGMKVVSVSLQKIWDTSNYIGNLAQRTLSRKRQEVEIQEARLRARAEKAESDSKKRISIAKSKAEERIIKANEKLEVYRQESVSQIEQARLNADNSILEAGSRGERDVQELTVELNKLQNLSDVILIEEAKQKAAETVADGEQESTNIIEQTKNDLLEQKANLIAGSKDTGQAVLFIQQKLSHLFQAYQDYAKEISVDSLVAMDNEEGFNGAVNRGASAFVHFLEQFEKGLGISVKDILGGASEKEAK